VLDDGVPHDEWRFLERTPYRMAGITGVAGASRSASGAKTSMYLPDAPAMQTRAGLAA
jgi:hypothetical protein